MSTPPKPFERAISLVVLVLLLGGCLIVILPFLSSLLWAIVLTFCAWPAYQRVLAMVGQRRTIAALIMTTTTVVVLLLPFALIAVKLGDNAKDLIAATRQWIKDGPPKAPAWLAKIPVVGHKAIDYWQTFAGDGRALLRELQRFIEPAGALLLSGGLILGHGLLDLSLSILIAFFLFRDGHVAADRLKSGVNRISGKDGQRLLELAGTTVRSVVYGVLGTALIQGVTAGVGFLIAGIPGAAVLALITFFVSPLPIGPPLIWLPASIWLFHQGFAGWGIFMLIWGIGVSSLDNIVKPWLISQGCELPFILILFGMFGGALAFGFVGVFLGPTLLAIGYRLVQEWTVLVPSAASSNHESLSAVDGTPPKAVADSP